MDRWAIIVVRNNGVDAEILGHLFNSSVEAHRHARGFLDRLQGVTMEVVKIFVPLQGEPVCPRTA